MPFDDEVDPDGVRVVAPRAEWATEGRALCHALAERVAEESVGVEHIGSTSVPGLPAKDCLDIMIIATSVDADLFDSRLVPAGYRRRPEPWNREDVTWGERHPKIVYAGPIGARRCNVHVRTVGRANTRYALLFRDFLRADAAAAQAWGRFKIELASVAGDLADYGRIKQPATEVLMAAAERWAAESRWTGGSGR